MIAAVLLTEKKEMGSLEGWASGIHRRLHLCRRGGGVDSDHSGTAPSPFRWNIYMADH